MARVVPHVHPEARGAARDRLADAAEPDEPERRAVDVLTEVLHDVPARPARVSQVRFGGRRQARRREDEEERQVGRGLVEDPRRVAHRDAAPRRHLDIDVVVTDRDVGDGPKPAGGTSGDDVGVDAVGEQADDGVDGRGDGHQFVVAVRLVTVARNDDVPGVDQRLGSARGELAGDEHTSHRRGQCVV